MVLTGVLVQCTFWDEGIECEGDWLWTQVNQLIGNLSKIKGFDSTVKGHGGCYRSGKSYHGRAQGFGRGE